MAFINYSKLNDHLGVNGIIDSEDSCIRERKWR